MGRRTPKLKHHYEVFPMLETERLVLRQIVPADAEAVNELITDPEMYRYWGAPLSNNEKSGDRYIRRNLTPKPHQTPNGITWGIAFKEDDRIIGEIFIMKIEENRQADIGCRISMKCQNQGIATEAVGAVVRFCFEQTELQRLQATVAYENDASYKVLEKNGFVREGLLRQARFVREWRDYYIYSYLREDYMALTKTE